MASYLLDFNNGTSNEAIQEYLNLNQCTQIKVFDRLNKTYHVHSESQPPLTDIVSTIIDDTPLQLLTTVEVPMISSSSTMSIDSTNDNNWWKCYSLRGIDLDQQISTVKKFGQGINVYVVDSGIDLAHPEFVGQTINLIFSFTGEFSDNNGHGTALSSVIIGNTCGLTNSALNVVKIFDQNTPTKQSDLLNALESILEDAAISANKVSVVNLSWSIPKNSFVESKIQHLIDAGLIVIASAGNSGVPISDVTPASMSGVCTIGSYGQDFLPSDFSNYSNSSISVTQNSTNSGRLDSWAPGENVYLATANNNGYAIASGTSISAAIYSGSIAYNLSQFLVITGELPTRFRNSNGTIDFAVMSNFDRNGLLDLSDSRYAESINKICTYTEMFSNKPDTQVETLTLPIRMVAHPGSFISKSFIIPPVVKSYEILGDLPVGVTIDGLNININFQNEPISTQHVDHYVIPIRYDLRDGSGSINNNIEISLIGSLFDPTILPPDDPILAITLEINCTLVSVSNCGVGYCSGTNGIGSALVCVKPTKTATACSCE